MTFSGHARPRPRMRLTRRGGLVRTIAILIAIIAMLALAVSLVASRDNGAAPAGGAASDSADSARSGGAAGVAGSVGSDGSGSDGASAGSEEQAGGSDGSGSDGAKSDAAKGAADRVEPARVDSDGYGHTDIVGKKTWKIAAPVPAKGEKLSLHHTFLVRVEEGLPIDEAEAARQIQSILEDERGWRTIHDVSFEQVDSEDKADYILTIASPPTVDAMCAPLKTGGRWSCRNGNDVVLNADRWLFMTPTYIDLDEYRGYLVNHEVGHFLGHGHVNCEGKGLKAPVMLQQSMNLHGCVANAWPTEDSKKP